MTYVFFNTNSETPKVLGLGISIWKMGLEGYKSQFQNKGRQGKKSHRAFWVIQTVALQGVKEAAHKQSRNELDSIHHLQPPQALSSHWSFCAASVCEVSHGLLKDCTCVIHARWTLASTYYLWSFALCFDKNFVSHLSLPLGFHGEISSAFQPVHPRPVWYQDERRLPRSSEKINYKWPFQLHWRSFQSEIWGH